MCDATNYTSYGSGLTAVTDVRKLIVYIVDDIIVLFYRMVIQYTAVRGSLKQPANVKA